MCLRIGHARLSFSSFASHSEPHHLAGASAAPASNKSAPPIRLLPRHAADPATARHCQSFPRRNHVSRFGAPLAQSILAYSISCILANTAESQAPPRAALKCFKCMPKHFKHQLSLGASVVALLACDMESPTALDVSHSPEVLAACYLALI